MNKNKENENLKDEITDLKNKIKIMENEAKIKEIEFNHEIQIIQKTRDFALNEKFQYKREFEILQNASSNIISIISENEKLKSEDRFFEIKQLKNEVDNFKKELDYKDKLIKNYQELPDIKKILQGISELKFPNISDLKNLLDIYNSSELIKTMNKLSE